MLSDRAWEMLPRSSWRAKNIKQTQQQMRRSNYLCQPWAILFFDDIGVGIYLAHQFSLLLGLPFKAWVVAMFPFVLVDWGVV